jgi:chemotaxis protein MotB
MDEQRRPEEPENHERWLVSYADYITLLFAFFVVMFANSQVDKKKTQQFSDAVRRAYGERSYSASQQQILGHPRKGDPPSEIQVASQYLDRSPKPEAIVHSALIAEMLPSIQALKGQLANELADGKVQIHLESRGLVISLQEAAFFPPGDDRLREESRPTIHKLAEVLRAMDPPIRLEGHTDATPIATTRFPTNWHLSTARAIAMLGLLTSDFGMPPDRFAVAGYGDTKPVSPNDTAEGRARNRRVDVVVLSKAAISFQPETLSRPAAGGKAGVSPASKQ